MAEILGFSGLEAQSGCQGVLSDQVQNLHLAPGYPRSGSESQVGITNCQQHVESSVLR